MKIFKDFSDRRIRLTQERLEHILDHPEMVEMMPAIEETLGHPERGVESLSDPEVNLYYRFFSETNMGDKYLCVVVKVRANDMFILTAYLTDSLKRGDILWPKR